MNKPEIRKKIFYLRKKNYLKNLSIDSIKFLNFLDKKKMKNKAIGGYYPFNYELDILNIFKMLEKKRYSISLPVIGKNNKMNFFRWSLKEPMKINKHGIPEPISNIKVLPEILLIPLVAFDDQLNRLGYGGGYYDRYISRFKSIDNVFKIGIGFSYQKVKNLPINKYDRKLDCVITEKDIIE